ncbi:hypothetical protein HQ535_06650 [bacterium]|nr:hypothetical protein [bacterium]
MAIVLALLIIGASCSGGGGPSLSEDQENWCNRNRDQHGLVGIELGEAGQPGVTPEFTSDDFAFRSFEFYWTGEAGWNRACREAYERFAAPE